MNRSGRFGFTLVEIMIVVSIIGLLAAIAVPGFMKARTTAREKACAENRRMIDAAVDEAALERGWEYGDEIREDDIQYIVEYSRTSTNVFCPAGGDYVVQIVGSNTTCTYHGVD